MPLHPNETAMTDMTDMTLTEGGWSCPCFADLADLADGEELGDELYTDLAIHLEQCSSCRRLLEELGGEPPPVPRPLAQSPVPEAELRPGQLWTTRHRVILPGGHAGPANYLPKTVLVLTEPTGGAEQALVAAPIGDWPEMAGPFDLEVGRAGSTLGYGFHVQVWNLGPVLARSLLDLRGEVSGEVLQDCLELCRCHREDRPPPEQLVPRMGPLDGADEDLLDYRAYEVAAISYLANPAWAVMAGLEAEMGKDAPADAELAGDEVAATLSRILGDALRPARTTLEGPPPITFTMSPVAREVRCHTEADDLELLEEVRVGVRLKLIWPHGEHVVELAVAGTSALLVVSSPAGQAAEIQVTLDGCEPAGTRLLREGRAAVHDLGPRQDLAGRQVRIDLADGEGNGHSYLVSFEGEDHGQP